ncbi:hypothetical protein N657DRAFT_651211 [Parathielavia appendiculata]|uniref:Complex 1 LYR protein domain-containing protein n=1 Tax=Parathielavia appendiculata TaxID=2587402 RepID=A0AAN6TQN4_9PEZI|nr:hypothetical protein N657DRAFT_651211 [Parathielavia appendiculata]
MPSFFVPARSSRHRTACFALYRSLLRQGLRVPLPDDLITNSPLGPANPIRTLIRNGFRRNKRDTSHRLVISALKNGYRFLTLLSRAADASTPEHASVLTFLRENQARVVAVKAKREAEAASRISTAPIEGRTPLIKKISAEGEPPVYAPTGPPRPLSSFRSGVRKPPTLAATMGVPFLRLKKPQPRFLERVLRQKSQRRWRRIEKIMEMMWEGLEEAGVEDAWDRMMERLLAEKRRAERKKGLESKGAADEGSYKQTLQEALTYSMDVTERERQDLVARAKAMWQIVLAEQEMALLEERERLVREGREGEEPQLRVWKRPVYARNRKGRKQGDEGTSGELRGPKTVQQT